MPSPAAGSAHPPRHGPQALLSRPRSDQRRSDLQDPIPPINHSFDQVFAAITTTKAQVLASGLSVGEKPGATALGVGPPPYQRLRQRQAPPMAPALRLAPRNQWER